MCKEKYFETLKNCHLFQGLSEKTLQEALKYLRAEERSFKKGEIILHTGQEIHYAGIVLEGEIECAFQDYDFNKYNMNHFSEGDLFGETMACLGIVKSPMQVCAVTDCSILLLDFRVFKEAKFECQSLLTANLIHIFAKQNYFLNQKIRMVTQKDLRGKIFAYINSIQPDDNGNRKLPFSKTALSEFLCVNRTALSRELRKMINERILEMNGRNFLIIKKEV